MGFPTVGDGGSVWWLSEAKVAEWASLYPGMAILAEARKALAWLEANPGRRKTAGGMQRFLVGWFNRAVNDRSTARTTAPATPRQPEETPDEWLSRVGYCRHDPRCDTPGKGACLERFKGEQGAKSA